MKFKLIIAKLFVRIFSLLLPSKIMKEKKFFNLWENRGYHVTPNHFYEPIPDTRTLSDDLWSKQSDLAGINMKEKTKSTFFLSFSPV